MQDAEMTPAADTPDAGAAAPSLEAALARTEAHAEAALKAATAAATAIKRVRAAAHLGDLKGLRTAIDAAQTAVTNLRQTSTNAREGWDFDEEGYFASSAFHQELLAKARELGHPLFQQDDRLYSYPAIIRVLPNDRAVMIDKDRERRVRPSVLVAHLQAIAGRSARFKPEAFLESLYAAYDSAAHAAASRLGRERPPPGTVVRLLDVYDLLTLLPGQSRDYSRPEFARDVYLLDQSGVARTRSGQQVSFPASSGTRSASGIIRVVSQSGQEQLYYGIAFRPVERESPQ